MQMNESFSDSAKQKRSQGRPQLLLSMRKHASLQGDLQVRVEEKELALRTARKNYQAEANDVIFSLSVPNQLLYQWHRMVQKPRDYIPLLNSNITDQAVAIRTDCCQIAHNLACRAGRLRSQVASASSGKRKVLLGKCAHIPVHCGSTVAPQPLLEEVDSLRSELADALVEMTGKRSQA